MDHWSSAVPLPPLAAATLPPEVLRGPAAPDLISKFDLETILHVKDTLALNQPINALIHRFINHLTNQARPCDI